MPYRPTPTYDRLMAAMAACRAAGALVGVALIHPHQARVIEGELGMSPNSLRVLNGALIKER